MVPGTYLPYYVFFLGVDYTPEEQEAHLKSLKRQLQLKASRRTMHFKLFLKALSQIRIFFKALIKKYGTTVSILGYNTNKFVPKTVKFEPIQQFFLGHLVE